MNQDQQLRNVARDFLSKLSESKNYDSDLSLAMQFGKECVALTATQQAAPSQGAGEILDDAFDALATQSVSRYHVDETNHGFWPNCVRAGDGTLELFIGRQKQCTIVARRLAGAFTDGAFAMKQKAAALLQASTQREQHPDDAAVDRFAAAMKEKLAMAREKGRGGWQTCSQDDLSRMLRDHVEKGDPRDVANFCMFLWNLDYGIAQREQPAASKPEPQAQTGALK